MSQKKADSKKPETKKKQAAESAFETVPSEVKHNAKKGAGGKSSPKESKPAEKKKGKSSAAERGGAITPRSERMLHQAIPYILFVLTMSSRRRCIAPLRAISPVCGSSALTSCHISPPTTRAVTDVIL